MTYRERCHRVSCIQRTITSCPRGYCIVVFDVPEIKRRKRLVARRLLQSCGFVRLQQSVWYSGRDVGQETSGLFIELGFGDWVKVIEGQFCEVSQ